jgi:hypothetical protein
MGGAIAFFRGGIGGRRGDGAGGDRAIAINDNDPLK